MSINVQCPGCGKRYKVDDRFAGKKAKCQSCGGAIAVPAAPAPTKAAVSDDPFAAMDELERTGTAAPETAYAAAPRGNGLQSRFGSADGQHTSIIGRFARRQSRTVGRRGAPLLRAGLLGRPRTHRRRPTAHLRRVARQSPGRRRQLEYQ